MILPPGFMRTSSWAWVLGCLETATGSCRRRLLHLCPLWSSASLAFLRSSSSSSLSSHSSSLILLHLHHLTSSFISIISHSSSTPLQMPSRTRHPQDSTDQVRFRPTTGQLRSSASGMRIGADVLIETTSAASSTPGHLPSSTKTILFVANGQRASLSCCSDLCTSSWVKAGGPNGNGFVSQDSNMLIRRPKASEPQPSFRLQSSRPPASLASILQTASQHQVASSPIGPSTLAHRRASSPAGKLTP